MAGLWSDLKRNAEESVGENLMNETKSQLTDGLLRLAEVAVIDLPAAATLRIFQREQENELYKAGWKAYEAATTVVTELTNRAYANRAIGRMGANALERILKTQRVADAIAGAFFSALWPSLGLPTADDIESLRRDVKAMREEVRAAAYHRNRALHETESALGEILRESAVGARIHPEFDNASWVGWHALPAVEVRNRVRPK